MRLLRKVLRSSNLNIWPYIILLIAFFLMILGIQAIYAQPWQVSKMLTDSQFEADSQRKIENGYYLEDMNVFAVKDTARFSAIWKENSGPDWEIRRELTKSEYDRLKNEMTSKGFIPTNVSGYVVDGDLYFAGRWEKGIAPDRKVYIELSSEEYSKIYESMGANGYQPVDLSVYVVDGQPRFAGVWEQTETRREVRLDLSKNKYENDTHSRMQSNGFVPVDVDGYLLNGKTRYAGIWRKQETADRTVQIGLSSPNYESTLWNLAYRGHHPVQLAGYVGPEHAQLTGIWEEAYPNKGLSEQDLSSIRQRVERFMNKYDVPGLSIAIAKEGRLVFAQGYGTAIREDRVQTGPHHQFRIASLSKPITSAAIMHLWENGQLDLDQKVFGEGALLGMRYGSKPYGPNEKKVTVRHLLTHTTNAWNNDAPDAPMFQKEHLNHAELIGWVLDKQNIEQQPGSGYDYSNFGYCVLGRVIEAVSGQTYESYVKQNILGPAGIHTMAIAGNSRASRRSNEVVYYGQEGEKPYADNVKRMDAHGGWVASAVDLVRFGVHVDGLSPVPDLLENSTIAEMTTPSSKYHYAKGWKVNDLGNWWHIGSLPGSASILGRIKVGKYVWAVLVNTKAEGKENFIGDLDDLPHEVTETVSKWPEYDLFKYRNR